MSAKINPIAFGAGVIDVLPHAVPNCGGHIMVHHKQGELEIHDNVTPNVLRNLGMQLILAADMADALQQRAERKKSSAA